MPMSLGCTAVLYVVLTVFHIQASAGPAPQPVSSSNALHANGRHVMSLTGASEVVIQAIGTEAGLQHGNTLKQGVQTLLDKQIYLGQGATFGTAFTHAALASGASAASKCSTGTIAQMHALKELQDRSLQRELGNSMCDEGDWMCHPEFVVKVSSSELEEDGLTLSLTSVRSLTSP